LKKTREVAAVTLLLQADADGSEKWKHLFRMGGHSPGKPGKVREFESGQGSQGK